MIFQEEEMDTAAWLAKAGEVLLSTADRPELVMARGEGMRLWDTDGKAYLDFVGGWAVTCLGHAPAVVQEALVRQAGELLMAGPGFYSKPMIELAALLTALSGMDRAFFMSSGAEANEGAIKLARKYGAKRLGGAHEIVTVRGGFHGRTLATMAATGKPQWAGLFAPKPEGFVHVPLNDSAALEAAVGPHSCAVMLELVQGEGGVHAVDPAYLQALRRLCDERGLMLIYDEIQTGIGRTGKMFAFEHYGIEADAMTLGKGLGGGFPVSALLVKEKFDLFEPGDQGGTYTNGPLAAAAALAVVREVMRLNLPAHAAAMGEKLRSGLAKLAERHGLQRIRGLGLLCAFDLPAPVSAAFTAACLDAGLLVNAPGPRTTRLVPPLIAGEADIERMLEIADDVLGGMQLQAGEESA